ncbi:spore protease YyaC [Paenibacillus sp. FJAT-26967]|uniref:spore protease YyaC n=1 Tax=Paenibacillus sp. FJAT-26967 TaxID=1729690 RepID=UPI0008385CB0|nr:spore protease YyaC [Paenibacillus sp. FJAT-26967]
MDKLRLPSAAGYWKKVAGRQLAAFLTELREAEGDASRWVFVCIGTDRSTGDALGPLVGTMLAESGYSVIGTLEHPCDASNLTQRLAEIPPDSVVIGVDACLGQPSSVGLFQVSNRPIFPGKSMGKELPVVGDYTIAAVVNADGPRQYSVLQTTSLHRVMGMAREITAAVQAAFPRQA